MDRHGSTSGIGRCLGGVSRNLHALSSRPALAGEPGSFGLSPVVKHFFHACLIGAAGLAQLRFSRWFQRDISKILLRVFLLAVFVMIAGMWTFAIANRFWTIKTNRKLLLEAEPIMRVGTMLFRLGFWSSVALALLNLVCGLIRRPSAPSKS